jgi:hypothetical protein
VLFEEGDVFFHAPFGLVQTIFDGMPNARESFQVMRVESEKGGILCGFDDE